MTHFHLLLILGAILGFQRPAVAALFTNEAVAHKLSIDQLEKRAAIFDSGAIKELGIRKERSAVALLEKIADEPDLARLPPPPPGHIDIKTQDAAADIHYRNLSHKAARIALARIGVEKYFEEFIIGLSSSNGLWRSQCISDLGEIGDKKAVKYLIPILDDNTAPTNLPVRRHPSLYSTVAIDSLVRILPEIEKQFQVNHPNRHGTDAEWKRWWEQNKDTFDETR